jgi:RNA polymerase sigma factor (sigma-70 family)
VTIPDEELLARAQGGDHASVGELLERHGPAVRLSLASAIPKRFSSLVTLDDVLQQTYMDAFLDLAKFHSREGSAFGAWLTKLARRNLVDAMRMLRAEKRGGSRIRIEPDATGDTFVSLFDFVGGISRTPSREAAISESRTAIQKAMPQLPTTYQDVIRLYDLEGRPIEEVAKHLGRSTGAVYMVRARAHDRLAELLGSASQFFSDAS